MSKGFWIIIAAIVVIFSGILLFKGDKTDAPDSSLAASNHVVGENTKGVLLIEYGDYECSFCGQYYPIVKQVIDKYQNDIAFQFRNLPLQQNHKNAFVAARAAEAAALQGKFWEMHDLLFQNQSAWAQASNAQPVFEQYAAQLGLDIEKFKADFASPAVNDTINADIAEFRKTGAPMKTPTFFLNGNVIEPRSVEEFSQLIDDEIAKQQSQE
ncbi:MAG: DsbA family protein [Candidatus Saccharimonadales bacterium]